MDVRPAEAADGEAVGSVVRRSLKASYALSPEAIDEIVAEYAGDAVADRPDGGAVRLVAEQDGRVVGFAEGRLTDGGVGEIVWLHVSPGGRGQGAGTELFERTRAELEDRGATHVRAQVLADNQEGEAFFERFDLHELAGTEVERAGVEFDAHFYAADEAAVESDGATLVDDAGGDSEPVDVPDSVTVDGRDVYVDDEPIPGSEAPFFRTFDDEAGEDHWGYFCSNCGSTATAMDELERLECRDCGNVHRADEWDAAYL